MEQQAALRGLDDAALQQEMASPSMSPFLVLTEIGRRKSMRERYAGEKAKQGEQVTVAAELTGGKMPPMPPGPGGPMGGLSQAMPQIQQPMPPQGAPPPGMPAFAGGGLIDYDRLEEDYADRLGRIGKDDNAIGMALLAAAAGMMGNGSSNFMNNLGAGVGQGLSAYKDRRSEVEARDTATMESALNFQRTRGAEGLAEMQFDWQRDAQRRQDDLAERQLKMTESQGNRTPNTVEYDFFSGLSPEEQETYLRVNPPPSSGMPSPYGIDFGDEARIQTAWTSTFDDVYKEMLDAAKTDLLMLDEGPEREAKQAALMEQARQAALARFKALYPPEWSAWVEGNLRASGPAATTPAAAPSSGAVPYTDYFN